MCRLVTRQSQSAQGRLEGNGARMNDGLNAGDAESLSSVSSPDETVSGEAGSAAVGEEIGGSGSTCEGVWGGMKDLDQSKGSLAAVGGSGSGEERGGSGVAGTSVSSGKGDTAMKGTGGSETDDAGR